MLKAIKSPTSNSTEAQAVADFLCAVLDGYQQAQGAEHKYTKRHVRKLKDFFKEVRNGSSILKNQSNPDRVNDARADRLHAATWRIHHKLEKLKAKEHRNDRAIDALSRLQDYCLAAFETTYIAISDPNLDAATVIAKSNEGPSYEGLKTVHEGLKAA